MHPTRTRGSSGTRECSLWLRATAAAVDLLADLADAAIAGTVDSKTIGLELEKLQTEAPWLTEGLEAAILVLKAAEDKNAARLADEAISREQAMHAAGWLK